MRPSNPTLQLVVGFALLALNGFARAGDAPAAVPLDRYRDMLARSPFVLATEAPAPVVADSAGFAKDLVLTGIVRMAGGEYVSIASRDQSKRFGLMTGETYDGITVVSVAWSDQPGKTKATLKQGNEYGIIGFDEAAAKNGTAVPPIGGVVPVMGLGPGSNAITPGIIMNGAAPAAPGSTEGASVDPQTPGTMAQPFNPGDPAATPTPFRRPPIRTLPFAP